MTKINSYYPENAPTHPVMLLGDMNLNWGTDEYNTSALKNNFYDPYNYRRRDVRQEERTCVTDHLTDKVWHKNGENPPLDLPTIIDYSMILKMDGMVYTKGKN